VELEQGHEAEPTAEVDAVARPDEGIVLLIGWRLVKGDGAVRLRGPQALACVLLFLALAGTGGRGEIAPHEARGMEAPGGQTHFLLRPGHH